MKRMVLFFLVVLTEIHVLGQTKRDQETDIINHEVQFGESVRLISKKYLVDPAEIYKLNKFAVEGITQGMILKVPVPHKEEVISAEQQPQINTATQIVTETVPEPIASEKAITARSEGKTTRNVAVINRNSGISHTVLAKETLFSLSRKYEVSVDEIKLSNPDIVKNGLQIGQVINIPTVRVLENNESSIGSDETPTAEIAKKAHAAENKSDWIEHTVAPKETLYSLSKKYNVTVDEIKRENEALLKNGLKTGQVLSIRKNN